MPYLAELERSVEMLEAYNDLHHGRVPPPPPSPRARARDDAKRLKLLVGADTCRGMKGAQHDACARAAAAQEAAPCKLGVPEGLPAVRP